MNFSVLISVYEKEKPEYLDQCFASLYNQTVIPSEIVLVEDGPLPSGLVEVIKKYRQSSVIPMKRVKREKSEGLGLALQNGLSYCQYDWVARMDSDDICFTDRFEIQSKFIEEHQDLSAVSGYIDEFKETIRDIFATRKVPLSSDDIREFSKFRNPMNHMAVMFKRKDVEKVGNYRDFRFFEDYDLWVRMLAAGMQLQNIPRSLVWARFNSSSIERRRGLRYLTNEIKLFSQMLRLRHIRVFEYVKSVIPRIFIRLLPKILQTWFYKWFLRGEK